jgi:hypothetical protein
MMLTVLMIFLFYGSNSGPSWDCTLVLLLISLAPSISSPPPSRIIHTDKNPGSLLVSSISHFTPNNHRLFSIHKERKNYQTLSLFIQRIEKLPNAVSFQCRERKNYQTLSLFNIENGKTTKRCLWRTEKLPQRRR